MLRVINSCEKNVVPLPANAIAIPAGVSTEVVPDLTQQAHEYAAITVQNTGTNTAYYAFGQTADNVKNYHGMLQAGVQVNCPTTKQVQVYSPNGTTIAVTVLRREGGL